MGVVKLWVELEGGLEGGLVTMIMNDGYEY